MCTLREQVDQGHGTPAAGHHQHGLLLLGQVRLEPPGHMLGQGRGEFGPVGMFPQGAHG